MIYRHPQSRDGRGERGRTAVDAPVILRRDSGTWRILQAWTRAPLPSWPTRETYSGRATASACPQGSKTWRVPPAVSWRFPCMWPGSADELASPDRSKARMSLYRTVLAEGQHNDLIAFLDRGLLIEQWPVLRTLIKRHIRHAWEETFPELGADHHNSSPPPGTEHTGP